VLLVTHEMDEAEALCDRVVVMRAGHVIDAGAPADLVERHASTAVIRFSMPDPPAQLLDQVRRLDGVREVARSGARITVRGHRRIVAHVCAAWCAGSRCRPTWPSPNRPGGTPCSGC